MRTFTMPTGLAAAGEMTLTSTFGRKQQELSLARCSSAAAHLVNVQVEDQDAVNIPSLQKHLRRSFPLNGGVVRSDVNCDTHVNIVCEARPSNQVAPEVSCSGAMRSEVCPVHLHRLACSTRSGLCFPMTHTCAVYARSLRMQKPEPCPGNAWCVPPAALHARPRSRANSAVSSVPGRSQ
jgi:hypothetical protein